MRVTVLLENSTPSSRFVAKHGLSLFLEVNGRRILFDMGPDDSFLANARTLGVDVASADTAILSHGHYDHGGGLRAYLEATRDAEHPAPVYLSSHAFEEHASGTPDTHHDIGLDADLAGSPRLKGTGELRVLGDGLMLFSCTERPHAASASNARLLERSSDGTLVPDAFLHEQSLLIHEGERYLLVSGCSHAGILNIMDRAQALAGAPIDVVVAGFHLMAPSAGTVEDPLTTRRLARELSCLPTRYYTFHCTGLDAFGLLRDVLGERIRYLSCGTQTTV